MDPYVWAVRVIELAKAQDPREAISRAIQDAGKELVKDERRLLRKRIEDSDLPNKKEVLAAFFPPSTSPPTPPKKAKWVDLSVNPEGAHEVRKEVS